MTLRNQRHFFSIVLAVGLCAQPDESRAQNAAAANARPNEVIEGQTTITLPDTNRYTSIERALVRLERRRSAAIAAHDTGWLATLYASDFKGIVANGRRVDRAALFAVFALDNPGARFLIDELEMRGLGPTQATATGRLRTVGADGAISAGSRYLHVYVLRDDRWQLVSAVGVPAGP
jgi:Domain of unknown function (DUF4440)